MAKQTIYLKDYQSPSHQVHTVDLTIELGDEVTRVSSVLTIEPNSISSSISTGIQLNAEQLDIIDILIDDKHLTDADYHYDGHHLTIDCTPNQTFKLNTVCDIKPQLNTSLMGLYRSNTMYCTQCEAEGFRKITPFLDRPDVLSTFTTTVIGDKQQYPILLSNGNPIDSGDLERSRHFVRWHDPIPKPCYLFALVAGDLSCIEDSFTTRSGRDVTIRFYVEAKDLDKCDHAIRSLKQSMAWDEEVYGREYDLDIFMVVAVDDFNMGAMENKGLNIFNTSAVLANPKITTDARFQWIEAVVAHEYFHNWSGNRVTCRDWFQLSLKEGFTVFRDSQFSADLNSADVKRIEDVKVLRNHQFAEDAGPLSHPVQPDSFMEINNFYTLTVYEKGAEIVRMCHQILGEKTFRKGSDLYFDRHDGQAVTIEDFVKAMEDASGFDFSQFMLWYKVSGTPELTISTDYDQRNKILTLHCEQRSRSDKPMLIPLKLAVFNNQGDTIVEETVINITENKQEISFTQVDEPPLVSLLRGFSAPVKLTTDLNENQLLGLMRHDNDGYNQWDSGQSIALKWLQQAQQQIEQGVEITINDAYIEALRSILVNPTMDKAMKALMLQLPTQSYMAEIATVINTESIYQAHKQIKQVIAKALKTELKQSYLNNQSTDTYRVDAQSIAQRSLMNTCLSLWVASGDEEALEATYKQYQQADNMSNGSTALQLLIAANNAEIEGSKAHQYATSGVNDFYQRWKHENLAINLWLSMQTQSSHYKTLDNVKQLLQHEVFSLTNPNKTRSLLGGFCSNLYCFHDESGLGYQFLADHIIELNAINPQIAARLATPFMQWKKFPSVKSELMKQQLIRIQQSPNLSPDVNETIGRMLA